MPGPHDRHLRPYKLVYGGADTDDGSEGGSSSGSTAYEWSESDGNSDDENFVTEDLDEDEDATSDVSSEEDFYSSYDRDATPSSLLIELWKELQQLKEENEFSMLERGRGSEGGGDDPAAAIQCDAEMDPRYTACGRNWAAVGRSVQPLVLGDKFSCKGTPEVDDLFRTYKIKQNFRWANQPKHEELAYVGSEVCFEARAIVVTSDKLLRSYPWGQDSKAVTPRLSS